MQAGAKQWHVVAAQGIIAIFIMTIIKAFYLRKTKNAATTLPDMSWRRRQRQRRMFFPEPRQPDPPSRSCQVPHPVKSTQFRPRACKSLQLDTIRLMIYTS